MGFPATQFPEFCLRGRSAVFMTILGCLFLYPKIPFPAAVLEREIWTALNPEFRLRGRTTAFVAWVGIMRCPASSNNSPVNKWSALLRKVVR